MEEICVGEYVRTIDGYIRKVTQVNKKGTYEGICYGAYSVDKPYKNSQGISAKKIKSHSKDIIDLIEEGDLIKIPEGIFEVIHDESYEKLGILVPNKTCLSIKHSALEYIFSEYKNVEILTKEQFNQMKYIVGGAVDAKD